jgi:hypothetical protein
MSGEGDLAGRTSRLLSECADHPGGQENGEHDDAPDMALINFDSSHLQTSSRQVA